MSWARLTHTLRFQALRLAGLVLHYKTLWG
jgi:hypothetical protein